MKTAAILLSLGIIISLVFVLAWSATNAAGTQSKSGSGNSPTTSQSITSSQGCMYYVQDGTSPDLASALGCINLIKNDYGLI